MSTRRQPGRSQTKQARLGNHRSRPWTGKSRRESVTALINLPYEDDTASPANSEKTYRRSPHRDPWPSSVQINPDGTIAGSAIARPAAAARRPRRKWGPAERRAAPSW
ncbi:hypothetical protein GCM10010187_32020 [Actinomadura coerulea]|nr:hypothetical protein GCM10010187_32020 [Actinomadura coerulea]